MPFTGDTIAAQKVQERLKSLYTLIHDIEKKRQQSEAGMKALTKFQNGQDDNSTPQYQAKLKSLYKMSIAQAEQEEEVLREALQKISEIKDIKHERLIQVRQGQNKETIRRGPMMKKLINSAQSVPLFVSRIGERPPPLCGAIAAAPNYHAKAGDMVATYVEIASYGETWILAEVVSFNPVTGKYEVDDILEEQNQPKRYTLHKKLVVPLPLMRANPETDPGALFPVGTVVLALFPQTTCFYNAIIKKVPATHMDSYEVLFEDQTYPDGYSEPILVAQRYVIAAKNRIKNS